MRETREPENAAGVDRRFVLQALGGSIALGSLATEVEGETDGDEEYAVVQDDECVPLVPLSDDLTVEELYDLRIPDRFVGDNGATDPRSGPYYESNGTSDLQRENTTITFLYDGPDGLSLVVVHDKPDGADGGSVSWTLEDVPSDAAWVVKDDFYIDPDTDDEVNFDRWSVDGSEHVVDWTWGSAGTDGGALRPLDDEFSIEIDPAFNEQAALWGEHYAEDPITDWQVLSFPDGREKPERTSLALDEGVTIRAGACDDDDSAGKIADPDEKDDEDRKDHEKDEEDDEDRDSDRDEKDRDDEKDDDQKEGHEDEGEDTDEDEEEKDGSDEKEDEGKDKDDEKDEDEDEKDEKDEDDDRDEGEDSDKDEEEKGGKDEKDDDEDDEKDEDEDEKDGKDEKDKDDDEDDEDKEEKDEDEEGDDEKERGHGNGRGNGRGDESGGNGGGNGRGNDR